MTHRSSRRGAVTHGITPSASASRAKQAPSAFTPRLWFCVGRSGGSIMSEPRRCTDRSTVASSIRAQARSRRHPRIRDARCELGRAPQLHTRLPQPGEAPAPRQSARGRMVKEFRPIGIAGDSPRVSAAKSHTRPRSIKDGEQMPTSERVSPASGRSTFWSKGGLLGLDFAPGRRMSNWGLGQLSVVEGRR